MSIKAFAFKNQRISTTSMHKRLVSGCSLDFVKNSYLYLEQFTCFSNCLLNWEHFIRTLLLRALGPFVKQIRSYLAGEDEEGGLGSGYSCDWHRFSALDWLWCLWSQTKNRSWFKVLLEPPPLVREHWFPKHHQRVGNKHELLHSAFINC